MMKNNKLLLSLLCGSAIVLTGCSKKLSPFSAEYFTTAPTPLEVVGDKVPATVTGNIPAKFFLKNAEVTITPYLVYGDKETAAAPYMIQGEKVRGNNLTVPYEYGATVTVPVMYNYDPEMMKSNLYLAFEVKQGKKQYVLPRVKVGEGVIATSTLADATTITPAVASDKFQRIINEKYDADINFLVNQTNIRADQLKKESLGELHKVVKEAQTAENREIEGINISSYASPEGGVKLNTRIAEGREKSTQQYLNSQLKKDNIKEFGDLTAEFTAQDWEGFQKLVSASNIQDKQLILSVLSMYSDPEIREREIRNLSSVFDQLAKEILPQLRYSRLTASINVIGKSDEELLAVYEKDPKTLSVDELLYVATLVSDNNKKLQVYNTVIEVYPQDYRGYNNLGMCQYIAKDYESANQSFAKAARIAPNSKEVAMNEGLQSLLKKNYKKANEQFGASAGVKELSDAMGVYYLMNGDYNAAVKAFDGIRNNNSALALILTKDYSGAKNTLASISNPDATTYYLMAVLGARTNNEQMVLSNLRQAAKLDKSMGDRAVKDLEFTKFNLSSAL